MSYLAEAFAAAAAFLATFVPLLDGWDFTLVLVPK